MGGRTATTASGNLLFSPPFKSYSFDGLVTFTNTQGALSRDDGGATVIDGGFISTDTIEVDSLKASALDTITAHVQDNITIGGATSIDTSGTAGTTGQRMVLTDNLITIYDSSSTSETTGIRVKLGNLS